MDFTLLYIHIYIHVNSSILNSRILNLNSSSLSNPKKCSGKPLINHRMTTHFQLWNRPAQRLVLGQRGQECIILSEARKFSLRSRQSP